MTAKARGSRKTMSASWSCRMSYDADGVEDRVEQVGAGGRHSWVRSVAGGRDDISAAVIEESTPSYANASLTSDCVVFDG